MNDYSNLEKTIVRELSCRLCLCTDVIKLKPLSAEVKRKIKKLFNIVIRADDHLPKAICHDCLQQVGVMHLYAVKVDKTQKFLDFHKMKALEEKREYTNEQKLNPLIAALSMQNLDQSDSKLTTTLITKSSEATDHQQGDTKQAKPKKERRKTPFEMKFMEAMPLEEFAITEKVDTSLLNGLTSKSGITSVSTKKELDTSLLKSGITSISTKKEYHNKEEKRNNDIDFTNESLDPIVLLDGKPAKQGVALDKQITLFYKMECCICHETGFHFRSLMKHYKERHGVPGYVTCCDKKFHYFYPKKIIEHMAYHLQPDVFKCSSCHQNFHTSQELNEHQSNGGRSEGKIICPRCNERYPTYHELGWHIVTHRTDKMQCDYCGKQLKHHHRKKTVNHMEEIILCSHCMRILKSIERQEKDIKERVKSNKAHDTVALQRYQKFRQAMGLSGDEDASTD